MSYKNGKVCLKSFPVLETVTESVPEGSYYWLIEKKTFKLYPEELNGMGDGRKNKLKLVPGEPETVKVIPDHRSVSSHYQLEWE
ncbi:MAG: hypothetical protein JW754_04615 [Candidatus Aenigmarchaeota archaeon]|nr:hypothetical protein [Candidatus Aenigmarchaeota archaeon]